MKKFKIIQNLITIKFKTMSKSSSKQKIETLKEYIRVNNIKQKIKSE
jgi:hypothetical protein